MKNVHITEEVLDFLKQLEENNNREWFLEHKKTFKRLEGKVKAFYNYVLERMRGHDEIDALKMFRIYRDIRFSRDKTPYKAHFAGSYSRAGAERRGGYYLQIKPGGSFAAAGFWEPNPQDLLRIRKELELDASRFREVIAEPGFAKIWGELQGEALKTAPRGFQKDDPNIELIRRKRFIFVHRFADQEVTADGFADQVNACFQAVQPFFNLMSEILTTDLNGESVLD